MGAQRLTVSNAELWQMRNNGMTNADIARSLGVTPATIIRHIGPQPGRNWEGYKYRMGIPEPKTTEASPAEHELEAVLCVINRCTYLSGKVAEYCVDAGAKAVKFKPLAADGMVEISFDDWATFAREVAAIGRNLAAQRVPVEAW